ncbi:hypothetical protein Tco_0344490 [Tanacetum coccineum]
MPFGLCNGPRTFQRCMVVIFYDMIEKTMEARFGGNDATKKTQKALLKQQYENFNATSSESLDSIFNRLQKLVSRLAILGVDTPPEDLNVKFLRSLPSEWDTHVVVWMNKPDFETMGLDDLYNNFKIVEQKVKRTVAANNDDKNLAFLTTSSPSSTNTINTVNTGVSTGNTKVNTASTETSTASFSDATVYAFLSTQPQGSQLVHEDLEQLQDDDLEEMDLKWNMELQSMRARKFYQRTGRKIIIDGSSTAGYDKSKSDMEEDEIQANMALMAFTDSEVSNDKSCSKSCLQNYEALKKQYDDLIVKLDDTGFKAATYKRGLSILEAQVVKYKESEVLFSEKIALLKRSVGHKEYLMGLVKTKLEKVKEEKGGFEFKLAKFEKSSKDLDDLLASQQWGGRGGVEMEVVWQRGGEVVVMHSGGEGGCEGMVVMVTWWCDDGGVGGCCGGRRRGGSGDGDNEFKGEIIPCSDFCPRHIPTLRLRDQAFDTSQRLVSGSQT